MSVKTCTLPLLLISANCPPRMASSCAALFSFGENLQKDVVAEFKQLWNGDSTWYYRSISSAGVETNYSYNGGGSEILVGMQGVTHLRNDDKAETFSVQLKNGKTLSVTIHPGHQDKSQNNIYAIATPEKYVVCHTGDQYHKEDVKWYADVKKISPRIDALIVNCWTNSLDKLLAGFNPRYAITGHENEMGHSIDHREAFWLTFEKFEPLPHDYVVLAWGEWFTIK